MQNPASSERDRASATVTMDSDSICALVKPKTIKIGFHIFVASRSPKKGIKSFTVCGRQIGITGHD